MMFKQLKKLPIPFRNYGDQQPVIELVNQILDAKKAGPATDTKQLGTQIDKLVYKLYDLTEEEIAIIEGTD